MGDVLGDCTIRKAGAIPEPQQVARSGEDGQPPSRRSNVSDIHQAGGDLISPRRAALIVFAPLLWLSRPLLVSSQLLLRRHTPVLPPPPPSPVVHPSHLLTLVGWVVGASVGEVLGDCDDVREAGAIAGVVVRSGEEENNEGIKDEYHRSGR